MKSVAEAEIPTCSVKLDKKKPKCGLPMFRIGTEGAFAWVCAVCDEIPIDKSIDLPH